MSRELDERCARLMGLEIIHEDWPCGVPPDGCSSEAALQDDDSGYWFNTRRAVYKICEPEDEWRSGLGLWCAPVPLYSTEHAAAHLLEDEIERRGLQEAYSNALLAQKETSGWIEGDHWFLIRATPEQRARAFVAVTARVSSSPLEETRGH